MHAPTQWTASTNTMFIRVYTMCIDRRVPAAIYIYTVDRW